MNIALRAIQTLSSETQEYKIPSAPMAKSHSNARMASSNVMGVAEMNLRIYLYQ